MRDKVHFAKHHSQVIVGILDIVGSTQLLEPLEASQVDEFCTLFLEKVTSVVRKEGGVALKNTGDGLLFYFLVKDSRDRKAFLTALAAGKELLRARSGLNAQLVKCGLPTLSYRISMSYGPVSAMLDSRKRITDIFGAVVSTCSKMNKLAKQDTLVVGEAFHTKVLPERVRMEEVAQLMIAPGKGFAVYEVQ